MDSKAFCLLMMAVSMVFPIFAYYSDDIVMQLIKTLNFFLPYAVGYNVYLASHNKEKLIKDSLFSIYMGYSLYVSATYFYNLSMGFNGRWLVNLWGEGQVSATLTSLLCTFVSAYSIATFFHNKKLSMKLFAIYNLVIVLLLNSQTGTRAAFLILLLSFIGLFISSLNDYDLLKKFKRIFVMLIILILFSFIYSNNIFGLKDAVFESNIFERFIDEGLETGREELSQKYFEIMFNYPFGGGHGHAIAGGYAHNIWQDCYDTYGIFATFFLLLFTLSLVFQMFKLFGIKNKKPLDFIIITIYGAVLLQFFIEPILSGYPLLFWNITFIHGLTINYYRNDRRKCPQ